MLNISGFLIPQTFKNQSQGNYFLTAMFKKIILIDVSVSNVPIYL